MTSKLGNSKFSAVHDSVSIFMELQVQLLLLFYFCLISNFFLELLWVRLDNPKVIMRNTEVLSSTCSLLYFIQMFRLFPLSFISSNQNLLLLLLLLLLVLHYDKILLKSN